MAKEFPNYSSSLLFKFIARLPKQWSYQSYFGPSTLWEIFLIGNVSRPIETTRHFQ